MGSLLYSNNTSFKNIYIYIHTQKKGVTKTSDGPNKVHMVPGSFMPSCITWPKTKWINRPQALSR